MVIENIVIHQSNNAVIVNIDCHVHAAEIRCIVIFN